MEIKGKLIAIMPSTSGTSAKGEWHKSEILIETLETYPKKVVLTFMGKERSPIDTVSIGSEVNCHINIESREYNGRYYTNVNCWKYEVTKGIAIPSEPKPSEPKPINSENESDVPF